MRSYRSYYIHTLALLLAAAPLVMNAAAQQSHADIEPAHTTGVPATGQTFTLQQILPLTVHQAWLTSGKNEESFFDIVTQLAEFSAKNRDLQLPQTKKAGEQAGNMIKTMAKEDTDQLLYAIVDAAVRKIGTPIPPKQ